jgi:hypothetical protein
VARIVAITPDLLLGSKVEAMLSAAGHDVTIASALSGAKLEGADLVVADLDAEDPQALSSLEPPTLGYYSHVNANTKQTADAAGIAQAVPRSRMARELPQLVDQLLSQ